MKRIWFVCLALILALALFGCGSSDTNTNTDSGGNTNTQTAVESQSPEEKAFEVIELTPDSEITRDGDYILSGLYSDIITDTSMREGWFYYYSVGTEEKVPWQEWVCADGMYTSCELYYTMQNLKENMDKTYVDRFSGFIVFNADLDSVPQCSSSADYLEALQTMAVDNPGIKIFYFTPLQNNPGQLDTDGYETRSKDAVTLEKGETAKQSIIADIPEDFLRSWENPDGIEPMWAVFSLDDNVVYVVNLKTYLVEASDEA